MQVRVELAYSPDDPPDEQRVLLTFTEEDEPDVEIELTIAEGGNRPTAVTFKRQEGVTSRDLRVPIDHYLAEAQRSPALAAILNAAPRREIGAPRKRRLLTDDYLRRVARAYTEGGQTIAGVKAAHPDFRASDSQVSRWLRTARERGILTDEGDDGLS